MPETPNRILPLTLANLRELDFGKLTVAFEKEMAHIVKDLEDRPSDKRPRKLSLVFAMVPHAETEGTQINLDSVLVQAEVASSVPKRRTRVYSMQTRASGTLVFHADHPDSAEADLFDGDETPVDVDSDGVVR